MRKVILAAVLTMVSGAWMLVGMASPAHADLFFSEDDPSAGHVTANGHGNIVVLPTTHIPQR